MYIDLLAVIRHEAWKLDDSSSMDLALRGRPLHAGSATQSFSRIPIETLQEIFLHCRSPSPSVTEELAYHSIDLRGHSPQIAPLLLCQICRSWRQAAISFPDIWTSLDIFVSVGKARPSAPLAATWLARSGTLPLSLSLHQQNEFDDNCIAAGEIFELYKQYISRWHNIHFDLTNSRYYRSLTSQQRSAPMLKEFSIGTSHLDLFGIFDFVPRLSNLRVPSIPNLSHLGDCSVPIPWSQLVSLSLDYIPSVCASLHILEKCPNLTDVSFKLWVSMDAPPLININPVHHKLRSLTINLLQDQLSLFLGHVTFPGLIQATIYAREQRYYEWPQAKLEEFLERSQCRLVHFEIHQTGMNYTDFAACVCNRHLQSLVRFLVDDRRDWTWDPFFTDQAVGLLTCSSCDDINVSRRRELARVGDSACLLPNLESISIRGTSMWTTDGMVADMIESRWRFHHCKRLKYAELEMPSSQVEDIRRLKEFCSEGLELDIILR